VLGVLEVYTREPRRFTSDEMRLLFTFASQSSVALKNALLVEQANRRLMDLEALNRLSAILTAGDATEIWIPQAIALLVRATRSVAGNISIAGEHGQSWRWPEEPAEAGPPGFILQTSLLDPHHPEHPKGRIELSRTADLTAFDGHDQNFFETGANLIALRLS
jgi:hypothetical protein